MEQELNVKKPRKQVRDERKMEANKKLKCYERMKMNLKDLLFLF